jgi:hypothetical protein
VTSPYRNDVDALRERKGSLERELSRLREQTSQLEGLRSQEQALERELSQVAQQLGASTAKRSLPMLDQVRVASPCNANWNEMLGDERVRFCVSCEKNVYNLSAMPREDAERLLQERLGKDLCVRFYQRADGTILTEDCPVGVKKKRRKKLALAVAGAGAMAFGAMTALARQGERCVVQGAMAPTMGEAATVGSVTAPQEWRMGDWAGNEDQATAPQAPSRPVMGAPTPPKDPAPTQPTRTGRPAVMGKRSR